MKSLVPYTNPRPALILIIAVGFLLYYQSTSFDFLLNFDDDQLILENEAIKGLSFKNLTIVFTESVYGLYHPITTLSWAVENHFFGSNPYYFHLNNILLHLFNTLLVFVLIKKLTQKNSIALFCSLLFVLHPMHVENIVWVSSRKDLMYGLFFLAALIQYVNYKKSKRSIFLVLTTLFFILSLLSKSNAVVFPAVLILVDYYLDKKISRNGALAKLPFFILSGIFVWITLQTQSSAGFIKDFEGTYNWFNRIFMGSYSLAYYLFQFILPLKLAPKNLYPAEVNKLLPMAYYLSFLFLVTVVFLVSKARSKHKLILGLGLFLLIIAPVLKIIPTGNDIVSNRYTYLPYIGLYFLWGTFLFNEKIKWLKYATAPLLIFFVFQSYAYQKTYKNSYSVWTAVIESAEHNPTGQAMALNERGQTLMKQKRYKAAFRDINKALEMDPMLFRGLLNRSIIYDLNGNYGKALADLNKALTLRKEDPDALRLRGMILTKTEKVEEAINDFNRAIQIDSANAGLYNNRAIAYCNINKFEKAKEDFNQAIQIAPNNLSFKINKAKLLLNLEQIDEAIELYTQIYQKSKSVENAYRLAKAYMQNEQTQKAAEVLQPYNKNVQASAYLADQLLKDGYYEQSLAFLNIAMVDQSKLNQMLYMRSIAYRELGEYQLAVDDLLLLIEKVPNKQLFFEIGYLYLALNQIPDACHYWKEAQKRKQEKVDELIAEYCGEVK